MAEGGGEALARTARAFRLHAWAFGAGAGALAIGGLLAGALWTLWAIVAWGAAFAAHCLLYKAQAADERWADERAAELRAKSYDAAHIEAIRKDEGRTPPADAPG